MTSEERKIYKTKNDQHTATIPLWYVRMLKKNGYRTDKLSISLGPKFRLVYTPILLEETHGGKDI